MSQEQLEDYVLRLRTIAANSNLENVFQVFEDVLNHPNAKKITKIPGKGFLRLDINEYVKGVTKLVGEPTGPLEASILKNVKSPCLTTGFDHGTLVHCQMESLVAVVLGHMSINYLLAKHPLLDVCVLRILEVLIHERLYPIFSEFVVYDPLGNYGTAIDLICYYCPLKSDEQGKFIAIELKTGYDNEVYNSSKVQYMKRPFGHLKLLDSHLNRHQLQLLAGMLLSKLCYSFPFEVGCIIRASPKADESYCYPLDLDRKKCEDTLLAKMRFGRVY